jgi:eukaryotic-like serine/threonine-protein kinase
MKRIAQISYKRIKQIGVGQGMNSEVYLADELQLGGVVAVKEIPKANLGNTFVEYFAEAQAMFASQHSHVIPIQYACELPDTVCLVMPFFRNGSLTDRISQSPVSLSECLRIGQGILSGLSRIHAVGHIHFDIKPSNILFSDADTPMVSDFGQSRTMSPTGVTAAPPMYPYALPPEFFKHGVGTVRSDVYQTGLTLYRAVNGDAAFKPQIPADATETQQKTMAGKFPNRNYFLPHVPSKLRRAIRKSLKVDPIDRFSSAPEFADALARIDLPLDWQTSQLKNGEIEWMASRDNRPAINVRLLEDGSRWRFELHTKNGSTERARDKSQWKRGLTKKQAFVALKDVFDALN